MSSLTHQPRQADLEVAPLRIDLVTTYGINEKYRGFPEYQLAAGLSRAGQRVRGYTYAEVIGEWGRAQREEIAGAEIIRTPHRGWWAPGLSRQILADRPALGTIYHWSNQLAYMAGRTYHALGIPYTFSPLGILHDRFLVDDRDRPYERPPQWHRLIWSLPQLMREMIRSRSPRRVVRNYLTHHPLFQADLVVALSRAGQRLYQEMGIPAERTRALPLGIDLNFCQVPEATAWRDRWPRPVVMYIGQLKYRKGWDILVRAIPRVLERHPTASFVFNTHSPVERSDFERLIAELGIGRQVHLLQRISEEEKARLYQAADLLCLPTRYESFGLPIVEAMAAGCPVVSTRLPVIDEIITDGYDGLLAPYDDPPALATLLADLLADEPRRRQLAANGLVSVRRFDIDRVSQLLLTEYRDLLARHQKRAGRRPTQPTGHRP